MEIGVDFPTDREAFVLVEPGDGAFDDPPDLAESDDALRSSFGDDRCDSSVLQCFSELSRVVALVGEDHVGSSSWPSAAPFHGGYGIYQGFGCGDVVDVPAGGHHGERYTVSVASHVVFGPRTSTVDWRRAHT